jgi:hypothetical protein
MEREKPVRPDELQVFIGEKLKGLVREAEDAGFRESDIVGTIEEIVRTQWTSRRKALDQARTAFSGDFISDGNEG